jgi:hypothetical protein
MTAFGAEELLESNWKKVFAKLTGEETKLPGELLDRNYFRNVKITENPRWTRILAIFNCWSADPYMDRLGYFDFFVHQLLIGFV